MRARVSGATSDPATINMKFENLFMMARLG